MKRIIALYLFLHISVIVFAQQNFVLSGTVKDKQGQPLPGAGVYVSGYKAATSTNDAGSFSLNLKPGNYDILIQMIGYKAINKNVIITDKDLNIQLRLDESTVQLNEVTIKADPNRQGYINQFIAYFIGTTPNAKDCKILNPEILYVDYDKDERVLKVKTTDFLVIENKALGYRIKYLVNNFEYNYKSRVVYYEGYPHYEDLKGSAGKIKKWAQKRLVAYNGSPQHFFTSLFKGKATEEGFMIYKLVKQPNTSRPPDSLINANIKKYTQAHGINSIRINMSDDSLNYWLKKRNLPASISILNRSLILPDTLVHPYNESIKSLNFKDVLYVMYTKEEELPEFGNLIGMSISRPLDIPNYQISLVNTLIAPIYFYGNGSAYNPRAMLFEGYWAWEKMADSVPMDYLPPGT